MLTGSTHTHDALPADLTSSDSSPNTDRTSIRRLAVKKDLIMFLDGEEGGEKEERRER